MGAPVISSTLTSSVIVCAFTKRRWPDLLAAMESLTCQTRAAEEIVVVVDHNAELLARARAELPMARVVANRYAAGLSGARNTGVRAAHGDVLAFMDDDALADPDWLRALLAGYAEPDVIAVGGVVLPRWERGRPQGFPEEFDWVVGCSYRGMPTSRTAVRNLIGANMSFRREVFDAVGGFADGIGRVGVRPAGCEETELCIRARAALPGAVILYDPVARVSHRVPAARASWRYFGARCFREGVSKAQVTQRAGLSSGLSSERTHATRVIPRGIACAAGAALRGDAGALVRAAALLAGLWVTTLGFIVGRARCAAGGRPAAGARLGPDAGEPVTPARLVVMGPTS